jgi:hypothetical protein
VRGRHRRASFERSGRQVLLAVPHGLWVTRGGAFRNCCGRRRPPGRSWQCA